MGYTIYACTDGARDFVLDWRRTHINGVFFLDCFFSLFFFIFVLGGVRLEVMGVGVPPGGCVGSLCFFFCCKLARSVQCVLGWSGVLMRKRGPR
jgi:hypothetical protein